MSDQIGVAVLGCGYWGINYVRVFNELPQTCVRVVCDQRPDRLREVGRRFPAGLLTSEIDEALRTDGVDAAVICTQATTHHDLIRRCLGADKHVLVEKPMTTRQDHAEGVIDLAASRGLTLMVGHTFLYNAGVRTLKACVEARRVGRVYYLYSRRTNLGPIRQDVNALWDLAPHDVSIFNHLLDDTPAWVSAVGSRVLGNCREDVGFISLGYPEGAVAHIHVSWADPNKTREVVVVGSDGRLVFDDLNEMEPVRIFERGATPAAEGATYGEDRLSVRSGAIVSPNVKASEPLKNQCSHFIECVVQGRPPLTCGRSGLEVVRVMEAIDRSVEHHGMPVELRNGDGIPFSRCRAEKPFDKAQGKLRGEASLNSPSRLFAFGSE